MSIRRFDTREWIEDGEARVEFEAVPIGTWLLYSDHAAEVAALTERAERAEKANALLRAECEAWREANGTHDWTGDADGPPYYITSVRIAMGMTDEAGALKGVE